MDVRRGLDSEKKALDHTLQRISSAKLAESAPHRGASPPSSPLSRGSSRGSPSKPTRRSTRGEADVHELEQSLAVALERDQTLRQQAEAVETKLRSNTKAHTERMKQIKLDNEVCIR
jgi:hypothetical protein